MSTMVAGGPEATAEGAVDGEGDVATTLGPTLLVERAEGGAEGRPSARLRRRPLVILRVVVVLAVVALVGATVAVRVELGDRRVDAAVAARAEARAVAARRDAALVAAAVASYLEQAVLDGDEAVAARREQVARLAALGLTEADMESALDGAQSTTRTVEAERDDLAADVEGQKLEDEELQVCLAEVRAAVDAAFQAANRDGVEVPATREICRSLAAARAGS